MKLLDIAELTSPTYLFQVLPGFDYAELDQFTLGGRHAKLLLAVPTNKLPGAVPSVAVLLKFTLVDPQTNNPHEVWTISPWLSQAILARLAALPDLSQLAAELKSLKTQLTAPGAPQHPPLPPLPPQTPPQAPQAAQAPLQAPQAPQPGAAAEAPGPSQQ